MSDLRQTTQWAEFMTSLGWKVEQVENNQYYIRKLPLLGSIIKASRISWPINLKEINDLARKHRALFVKIEPKIEVESFEPEALRSQGFWHDTWSLSPTRTIQIDLTKSEEVLLKSFEKDTRYSIHLAQRRNVKVYASEDIQSFYRLYKDLAKRKKFWIGSQKEVEALYQKFKQKNAALFLFAESENKNLVAVCLLLFDTADHTTYYHMAATSNQQRDSMAPYLLVWEAIRISKEKGFKTLDFDGIEDTRYRETRNWKGFTHFKKGFRGRELTYAGSFVKYYNPLLRMLYGLTRLLSK